MYVAVKYNTEKPLCSIHRVKPHIQILTIDIFASHSP